MITIYVGDADVPFTEVPVCLDMLGMMPKKQVEAFNRIRHTRSSFKVFSATLINYIGEEIEKGNIDCEDVHIVTEHGEFDYTTEGCMKNNWPHGLFSY